MSDQVKIKHSQLDLMGNILETLRFQGSLFFRSDLAMPWGFSISEIKLPRFHIILKGDCYIGGVTDHPYISAKELDIVMIPHGGMHWIADKIDRQLYPVTWRLMLVN